MSTETVQESGDVVDVATEVEQVQEPQADSEFLEGFNSAQGIETPKEPEPEVKTFAGYTEEELRKKLERIDELDKLKERDAKVFGTLGSLKQSIDAIKSQPQPQTKMNISKDSLKRLSTEYPELAEALAGDLSDAMVSQSFDSSQVDKVVDARMEKASKDYESKLLTVMHPDWKSVVRTDEFATWRNTLSAEDQHDLDNSWDAISLGERFTAFKQWKSKSAQTQQSKQQRLEAAITPKGGALPTSKQSDEDAFLAGFKAVRGR